MFLIQSFKKTNGCRFMRTLFQFKNRNTSGSIGLKINGRKKNLYHKTSYSKNQHVPLIKYNTLAPKWYFFCTDFLKLRTRFAAIFKSSNGTFFFSPLVEAIKLGSKTTFLRNSYKHFFYISVGVIAKLKFLKIAMLVSNIGYIKPKYATALGTFAKIRLIKPLFLTIILPSGKWLNLTHNSVGIIGRNAGAKHLKEYYGKASSAPRGITRIIVRSCAKNPVDHPNGGRTRGKMLTKTPWGKPAKKNK